MAITLDLKPEVEAELMAQAPAASAGLPATIPDATGEWEEGTRRMAR